MKALHRSAALLGGLLAVFMSLTVLAAAQDGRGQASQKKGTASKKAPPASEKADKGDSADSEKMPPDDQGTAGNEKAHTADDGAPEAAKDVPPDDPNAKVVRSDAEWRRLLTPNQYFVTRQKGTEPAFTGRYARGRHKGVFACVGCGAALFSSNHKFESGTGWPSFYRPVSEQIIATAPDFSDPFEARVEVMCARCDAHLGHVFDDGPPPTGLRYCINSVALRLTPFPGADTAKSKSASKATAKKTAPAKKQAAKGKTQDTPDADAEPPDDADEKEAGAAAKPTTTPRTNAKRAGVDGQVTPVLM